MNRKATVLLIVLMMGIMPVDAWAGPGRSFSELPQFRNLDRRVDVWALDNAVGSGILPGDPGDNLVHLARLAPGRGGVVRVEKELGPETFRGNGRSCGTCHPAENVAAFLRVMNATFNPQIAIQRNEAALELTPGGFSFISNGVKATVNKLLDLSNDENDDAIRVLTDGPKGDLDATATAAIRRAIDLNQRTIETTSNSTRRALIIQALAELNAANDSLGSGTDFTMGSANLLF